MSLSYLCPLAICEHDFIWKEGVCIGNQIKIRTGAISNKSGVLIRRGNFGHRDTDTQGRGPCEDRGRDWRDTAARQGTPRIAGNC